MSEGVDYAGGRPGGAALAAAGKTFAMRYVAHSVAGYNLTSAEVADLHGHGLSIGIVCERGEQRVLSGRAAGAEDAQLALAAVTALGFPADRPIYAACDFNASASQFPLIDVYLEGWDSVLGPSRTGIYGGIGVVDHCLAAGTARWGWQTVAWSGGKVSALAHVYQYATAASVGHALQINGAGVDYDRNLKTDFGQWAISAGGHMTPRQKGAGPVLGTVGWANWTPANALIAPDLSWKSNDRQRDEILNVVGIFDLVDAKGVPIDVDGQQPPKNHRDQVYLIDGTSAQPIFGAAAYMLRQDATPLVTPPPDCTAQAAAAAQAATTAAKATVAAAITKLQEV